MSGGGGGHDAPKKAPPPVAGSGLSHPLIAWLVVGPLLLFGVVAVITATRDPVPVALSVRLQTPGETRTVTLPAGEGWIKLEAEKGLRYQFDSPGSWRVRFGKEDAEWDETAAWDSSTQPVIYVKGGNEKKAQKFIFSALR